MKHYSTSRMRFVCSSFLAFIFIVFWLESGEAQSFSQNTVNYNGNNSITSATSLMFGPDGRLYVTEYSGKVKIFTIERQAPGDYVVLNTEIVTDIQNIQDHNDDGSLYTSTNRETIGLVVTGTASNPVFYVSSSDYRIGGGGGGGKGDVGLDTNSGIITRFSWTGSAWDVVDIVRGLPRSEENHATNGLEFVTVNGVDYLIVSQGGHTNGGAPSVNFAYTAEYALSAAVLSVNLTMLESMPILEDNGRKYIYDLPTLDDPLRANKNGITDPDDPGYDGIDVNDPFGGNDGLNQAIIVPGGPVQIFSPGYRNTYDLVVTQSGAVYVTDNGANGGWGGLPVNEGTVDANNDYDPNEPGSSTATADGEKINNKDHLTLVTLDIHNYDFGSFYGGHPNPTRANPEGAGLYTNPSPTGTEGAVFRTLLYDPDGSRPNSTTDPNLGLPANWPPVTLSNTEEGDWRGPDLENPDGPNDILVTAWGTNTNAIDEYTASNFEGAMKGNLIAGVNSGELRRVELNPDGTLLQLTSSFASGLGGNALGVTCNSDSDPFPGTIWVGTLSGGLIVLEPQDFVICVGPGDSGYDPLADNDGDGYTNQDEEDNGTDPCNGGSQPGDFDKAAGGDLVSDLNDPDDDSDGIPDSADPFQLGDPLKDGTDAFGFPVMNELFSDNPDLQGYMGLGLTGLMNNGAPNPNWLSWLDRRDDPSDPNPNDILGGAIGAMTMQMTSGTASGTTNTQEKGFQYGVQVDLNTGIFTVSGGLMNFDAPLQLYGNTEAPEGELGFFIGDGTQGNYIKFVATKNGLYAQQEVNDVLNPPVSLEIPAEARPNDGIAFYFIVDPTDGNVLLEASFDGAARMLVGSIQAEGALLEAIQNSTKDLAVGFSGTSNIEGVEVEGTWDYLNVTGNKPYITEIIEDIEVPVGTTGTDIDLHQHFGDDQGVENLIYSVVENSDPAFGASISGNILSLVYPSAVAQTQITVRATDAQSNFIDQRFTVTVLDQPSVLYRVNAGGPDTASLDDDMDWGGDTSATNSPYLLEPGTNRTYKSVKTAYSDEIGTTPVSIFETERYDGSAGEPNLTYSFPVPEAGNYEIRLFMGNGYSGTSEPGQRIFDVSIEGVIHPELDDIDLSAFFGHQVGGVISKTVEVTDGAIDIVFLHGIQNPLINGIEILGSSGQDSSTPIEVAQIEDQTNVAGEELDGSLVVSATGGDGNLTYSMTGAPAGVSIEPTNGQIGGTIGVEAYTGSPYEVQIIVDDEDQYTSDSVTISFMWYVTNGEPVIVETIPDLVRATGAAPEVLDLNLYFDDNGGVENLVYTVEENTSLTIGASIAANLLTIDFPSEPSVGGIRVRATDANGLFAEQEFTVTVQEVVNSTVLYRVNAGGSATTAIDGKLDWEGDTSATNSAYLLEPGTNRTYSSDKTSYSDEVDQSTTPLTIFQNERFDGSPGEPNLTYSFPVEAGNYEIRLYMGNGYNGTSEPGQRIFDVSIEGIVHPELDDIDLSALFGHQVGGMITKSVEVTDGTLDISFLHVLENPLINGIEILGASASGSEIVVAQLQDQYNTEGDELDGSLVVSASGGDGDLVYSLTGAPSGVVIDPATGVISGTVALGAAANSPYSVAVTVDDSDSDPEDVASTNFLWTVTTPGLYTWTSKDENENYTARHECSFVQAGNKFYLMGGRESATTVDIFDYTSNTWTSFENSAPFEFNHYQALEYQGLIWVIGAFKTNTYPTETPAEFIWIFDPSSGEWIRGPQIPTDRQRGSAGLAIHNDKFYIVGGNTIGHDGGYVSWFDEYDPATGSWTSLADAPHARDHFQAAVIDNKLYAVGGRLTGGTEGVFKPVIPEVDVYDFNTATWSTLPQDKNIPTPRAAVSVVNFEEKLVVIGGEVKDEMVYGVLVDDALKITEEYDPVTQSWRRLADLNFERHGTQAIVSGNGIFTTAGSANRGGGRQKNMEFFGEDAPTGSPLVPSSVTVPLLVEINTGGQQETFIDVQGGNVGIIITSMEISGDNQEEFVVSSGDLSHGLIKSNSSHRIVLSHMGSLAGQTASLIINYGVSGQAVIPLKSVSSEENPIVVTQVEDQNNVNGDVLDGTLVVSASGGDGDLVYSMTGAPAGVIIDPATGVISGTIAMDADLGSPYSVTLTVDDTDSVSSDAVDTSFTWTVTTGQPVVVTEIPDWERTVNAVEEILDLTLYFDDDEGAENLAYTVVGNTDPSIGAQVSGSDLTLSFPSEPAISDITVRATDAKGYFVEDTFKVRVDYEGVAIQVEQVPDQNNVTGDVLDGTLVISASGGDGDLKYAMTGAPAGVIIDPATGVISGTIAEDASLGSPYGVTVAVDDSDSESSDAVESSFTWTVTTGQPVVVTEISDLERTVNTVDEILDLTLYFDDDEGAENLVYTVVGNTDPSIGAQVSGSDLTLSFPSEPAISDITVRATDARNNFVEDTFRVNVISPSESLVLYRVNAGGATVAAIDGEKDWGADTANNNSEFLTVPGTQTISSYSMTGYTIDVESTTPLNIFDSERSDTKSGTPNMTYSFPVSTSGDFEIRLYFGNGWNGSSKPGQQIFDVQIEGVVHPEFDDIDVTSRFGHLVGGVISRKVTVTDGAIDIVFLHGTRKNPIINGIEILNTSETIMATTYNKAINTNDSKVDTAVELSLYPNPASSVVYLEYNGSGNPSGEMQLYDLNGHFVRSFDTEQTIIGEGLYELPLTGLSNGVYVLRFQTTNQSSVHSLQVVIKN